jgi:glyoxylase I family protein
MTTTESTPQPAADTAAPASPAFTGIHHVGLTVSDVDASTDWYGRVLGLERQFDEAHHGSETGGYAVVLGRADLACNIGLDHHPGHGGEHFDPTRTGLDHLCLQVPDPSALHEWATHLDDNGVAHSGVYAMAGMPISLLTFRDPDGIQLELIAFGTP